MKNTIFYYMILVCITISVSCSKGGKNCKVVSRITDDNEASRITITYDNKGRIISYEEENTYTVEITYNGLTGNIKEYFEGDLIRTANLTFDSQGRLNSYENFEDILTDTYRYYYRFKYNSEGYLETNTQTLERKWPIPDINDSYYKDSLIYNNGNLVSKITKRKNGTIYRTSTYAYDLTLFNKSWHSNWPTTFSSPFTILSGYLYLYPLLGKLNNNLVESFSYVEGSFTDNFEFEYTLDDNGLVDEYIMNRSNTSTGNTSTNQKFTIECK